MVFEKDKFDAQIQILDIRGISLTLDLSVKAVVRLSLQILMSTLDKNNLCHAMHSMITHLSLTRFCFTSSL